MGHDTVREADGKERMGHQPVILGDAILLGLLDRNPKNHIHVWEDGGDSVEFVWNMSGTICEDISGMSSSDLLAILRRAV